MRVRIEATPQELTADPVEVMERLAKGLQAQAPELARAMRDAAALLPEPAVQPRHQALQDSFAHVRREYRRTMEAMLGEIGRELDRHA